MKAVQSILSHTSTNEKKQIRSYLVHKYHKETCTRIALFDILSDNPQIRVQDVLRKCNRKFSRQTLYKTGLKLKNDILSFYLFNDLEGKSKNDSVEAECWRNLYILHLVSPKNATFLNEAILDETERKAKEYDLHSVLLQVAEYKSKNSSIKYQEYKLHKEVDKLAKLTIDEIRINNMCSFYLKNIIEKAYESDYQFRQKLIRFLIKSFSDNKQTKLNDYIKFNQLVIGGNFHEAYEEISILTARPSKIPMNFLRILYIDKLKVLVYLGLYEDVRHQIEKNLLYEDSDIHINFLLIELLCFATLQNCEDYSFEESYDKLCYHEKIIRNREIPCNHIKLYRIFYFMIRKKYQKAIFDINSLIKNRAAPIYFLKVLEITCLYLQGDHDLLEYRMDSARKIKYIDTPLMTRMKSIATYIRKSILDPYQDKKDLIKEIQIIHPWNNLSLEKTNLTDIIIG